MKRRVARSLTLLTLALCWGALSAFAGNISFAGTFDGTATSTPTGTPGVYMQSFTGDGSDHTYGNFSAVAMSTVTFNPPNPNITFSNGTFTIAFGGMGEAPGGPLDGSGSLMGTSSGTGTVTGPGMATFTINFVVTGGTGQFAGYTGGLSLSGTLTGNPSSVSIGNGSYSGSIASTPEPNAALLMGTALMAVVLGLACRRAH